MLICGENIGTESLTNGFRCLVGFISIINMGFNMTVFKQAQRKQMLYSQQSLIWHTIGQQYLGPHRIAFSQP